MHLYYIYINTRVPLEKLGFWPQIHWILFIRIQQWPIMFQPGETGYSLQSCLLALAHRLLWMFPKSLFRLQSFLMQQKPAISCCPTRPNRSTGTGKDTKIAWEMSEKLIEYKHDWWALTTHWDNFGAFTTFQLGHHNSMEDSADLPLHGGNWVHASCTTKYSIVYICK